MTRTRFDPADICARYLAGESLREISDSYGSYPTSIARVLERAGVPRRPAGSHGPYKQPVRTSAPAWVRRIWRDLYLYHLQPTTQIARECGVSTGQVRRALIALGVTLRPPGPRSHRRTLSDE